MTPLSIPVSRSCCRTEIPMAFNSFYNSRDGPFVFNGPAAFSRYRTPVRSIGRSDGSGGPRSEAGERLSRCRLGIGSGLKRKARQRNASRLFMSDPVDRDTRRRSIGGVFKSAYPCWGSAYPGRRSGCPRLIALRRWVDRPSHFEPVEGLVHNG